MIRLSLALVLGAVFGAYEIGPVRQIVQDQLLQPVEAISIAIVAALAATGALITAAINPPRS